MKNIFGLILVLAFIFGWFANLFTLVTQATGPMTETVLMVALRVVGLFAAPLGAILGYF